MKGKGLVKFFAIALTIICLIELFPTFYVNRIESKAESLSNGNETLKKAELDKLAKDTLNLGIVKMNYYDAKKHEMKLGLDLKGGLNLLLEISERDLLINLADNSDNKVFRKALDIASEEEKKTGENYTSLFFKTFPKAKTELGEPDLKLSSPEIFGTKDLSDNIQYDTSDAEVQKYLSNLIESKVGSAIEIIRGRIKKLKIDEPNIARVPGTGRILVELPGVTETDRVKKLLQTSARLEFWEVYTPNEAFNYINKINDQVDSKLSSLIQPSLSNAIISAKLKDTAAINKIIFSEKAKHITPPGMKYAKFMWAAKPNNNSELELYAIRGTKNNKAPLEGAVTDAGIAFGQFNEIQISMQMGGKSIAEWKELTKKNAPPSPQERGNPIAVVLDGVVYTAPTVNSEIPNGQSIISGNFTEQEASDLVDILKSGKLPAKANIIQSEVVGPTLGQKSIHNGLISIIVSYAFILIWMIFYYGKAGLYANIALILNLFFLVGIMASTNAVLTLPGIAGIVLSMAMAVDANIIIFERVKDELRLGKPLKQAFAEGQKHALSAIVDGNLTTLIVGFVLLFSTGPIKGFAVTLVIGIFCTLFTAIFITSMMIYSSMEKGKIFAMSTNITKNWFTNIHIKWMEKRKFAYIFSIIIMIIAIWSIVVNGFDKGVDYTGGRTFVVKLDKEIQPETISKELGSLFIENGQATNIDAKKYGKDNQLRITTKYGIDSNDPNIDLTIREKLYNGLKKYLPVEYTKDDFFKGASYKNISYGIQSASEVGPTVASGIVKNGIIAVSIALGGIFIYILVRFRNWQMSTGAVISLIHDSIIVMGIFSILGWLQITPFSVEIDQSFIAAILTIIGYSINDTVIVFDRIREHKRLNIHHTMTLEALYNDAINHTLGRTVNTGISTIMVTVIIFLFGGESLQGFMFALFIGFTFGMYSSIYVASALSYDLTKYSYDSKQLPKAAKA